jgi:hypothetical protein
MRVVSLLLAFLLSVSPVFAQQPPPRSIVESGKRAAAVAADQNAPEASRNRRGRLFWPGVVLGFAGATATALSLTKLRVEDRSAGNSPDSLYRDCVTLATTNPVYASSDCNALKGVNSKLMWGGALIGAVGAVMIIGSIDTSAQVASGALRVSHRIRF